MTKKKRAMSLENIANGICPIHSIDYFQMECLYQQTSVILITFIFKKHIIQIYCTPKKVFFCASFRFYIEQLAQISWAGA